MNAFDYSILSSLNRFEGQYLSFDGAAVSLSNNGFLRGGIVAALCWWAWFKNGEDKEKTRTRAKSSFLRCWPALS